MSGNNVIVVRERRNVVVVDQMRETVELDSGGRNISVLDQSRGTVEIITAGPQGPQGEPGVSSGSGGIPPIAFSFGDATPSTIYIPADAGTFTEVRVIFDTPFNGTGAAIALGTIASPQALLATNQNDPSGTSEYENTPDLHVGAGTAVRLSITPGSGASQGAGRILLTFVPD